MNDPGNEAPTYAELEMVADESKVAAARELRHGLRELGDRLSMAAFWVCVTAIIVAVILH